MPKVAMPKTATKTATETAKSESPATRRLDSSQKGGEGRKLANFLCFSIYSANLAFGRAYKPILDQVGLTYPQYITIVALWEEDNQTVGSLGEKLFLESNTLTPLLKKLEAMGYVRRQRAAADERQVVVMARFLLLGGYLSVLD